MRAEQAFLRQQRLAAPNDGAAIAAVFSELVRALAMARKAIEERRFQDAHDGLVLAQRVLSGLRTGLGPEPLALVDNLQRLYAHCEALAGRANMEKSTNDIDQALQVIAILRDAWQEAASGAF